MGFFDKIKKSIFGGKDATDKAKVAASKAEKAVDDTADKAKEAANKAEKAVDDASDELKKE